MQEAREPSPGAGRALQRGSSGWEGALTTPGPGLAAGSWAPCSRPPRAVFSSSCPLLHLAHPHPRFKSSSHYLILGSINSPLQLGCQITIPKIPLASSVACAAASQASPASAQEMAARARAHALSPPGAQACRRPAGSQPPTAWPAQASPAFPPNKSPPVIQNPPKTHPRRVGLCNPELDSGFLRLAPKAQVIKKFFKKGTLDLIKTKTFVLQWKTSKMCKADPRNGRRPHIP